MHLYTPSRKVFADEQSAVIAQLPSMDDAKAPNFFEAPSAGVVRFDTGAMMQVGQGITMQG